MPDIRPARQGHDSQQAGVHRYRSTSSLDYESAPWRLWEKSKQLF